MQTFMEGEKIEVIVGEAAKIDVGQAITYIKSGQAEIGEAVSAGKSEITSHTNTKIGEFDANASAKTTAFDSNASSKTSAFNSNYTSKLGDFNSYASSKTSVFNTNATNKTTAFNNNATSKTTDFNDNYTAKKAVIDGAVSDAQGYATTAKQYAIGEPSEPVGNSAKYWAQQASSSLSGLETRVTSIEGKIPSSATSGNQLTDKSYVDTADNNLQQQIDAITASSDVTDIVGTYAQLQAYDTSTLPNNSIIKVLQDESRDDETTYYRWVITGGVGAWVLIGEEGPYYTIAAADAKFQDALVSGTNIKTINGNSVLGSGNLYVGGLPSQTGHAGEYLTTDGTDASWDNVKLVENAQDENTLGIWQGSQQEWEQAEITDWRKWQTEIILTTDKRSSNGGVWVASNDAMLIYGWNNYGLAYGPWNNVTDSNVTSGTYGGGCVYINNTFIAYPSTSNTSGTCKKSSDGMVWESETYSGISYISYNPRRWCTFNDKIYCINTMGNLYSTSDGLSWSSMDKSNVTVITCSGSRLVVAGYGASGTWIGLYYSDDNGNTWTTVYPGALSSYEDITALVYFNNKFILIGPTSYRVSTDNCATWGDATSHNMSGVASDSPVVVINNRLVCFAASKMYYTTDGETWVEGITTGATPTSIAKTPGEDSIVFVQPGGYRGIVTFSSSTCYTTTTTPTTASTVYSAPNTASALTITSVGTGTITLSDSQVYNRQAGGDTQTYQDVASLYPNHLAFVDNVGVKIGNTLIADNTDTTEIEQDVENLESGKADVDLSNVSNTGTTKIAHNALPSNAYDDLTLGASNAYYTAPADGYVFVSKNSGGSGQYVNVYVVPSGNTERIVGFTKYDLSSSGIVLAGTVPISKGQRFTVIYTASGSTNYFRFIYANGSAWEKA